MLFCRILDILSYFESIFQLSALFVIKFFKRYAPSTAAIFQNSFIPVYLEHNESQATVFNKIIQRINERNCIIIHSLLHLNNNENTFI